MQLDNHRSITNCHPSNKDNIHHCFHHSFHQSFWRLRRILCCLGRRSPPFSC
jgi:hypothetical protein